jgi:CubicO group peptidase (beta-lactamase class C family)
MRLTLPLVACSLTACVLDAPELSETAQHEIVPMPPPVARSPLAMRAIVDDKIAELGHTYVGLAVIVIENGHVYQMNYGKALAGTNIAITNNTYFAIGSLTKTFTGTLLALFHWKRHLSWGDKLDAHIDEDLTGAREDITLRDLALHHSGLPDNTDQPSKGSYNSDIDELQNDLLTCTTCEPTLDDEEPGIYSNWGYALLADAVARPTYTSVPAAFAAELWNPLGMTDTGYKHTLVENACIADTTTCNYGDYGQCWFLPACNYTFSARAAIGHLASSSGPVRGTDGNGSNDYVKLGSGVAWSTSNDMAKWLAFHLGDHDELTDSVLASAHAQRTDAIPGSTDDEYAFFGQWHTSGGSRYLYKRGDVGEFRAFIGFLEDKSVGVVVLSNYKSFSAQNLGTSLLAHLD